MCNDAATFSDLRPLSVPLNVALGEGRNLQAFGQGNMVLMMNVSHGKESRTLHVFSYLI